MLASRTILTCTLGSLLLLLLLGSPSFGETKISEVLLPADIIVNEFFQAGSGLPVGKIQAVRGEVIVYHRDPAVAYRVKTGLPIYHGDTIRTRSESRILCRLIDGTIFSLAPDTMLTVLQCSYNSARKASLSYLSLKNGDGRFKVNPSADIISHEFKIETVTAFAQTRNADFIIKTNPASTEIITFEESRLEVTNMAVPEALFFLTDYQRTVVEDTQGPQMAESVTQAEAEAALTEIKLSPRSHLFAASAEKYRDRVSAAEPLESDHAIEE